MSAITPQTTAETSQASQQTDKVKLLLIFCSENFTKVVSGQHYLCMISIQGRR